MIVIQRPLNLSAMPCEESSAYCLNKIERFAADYMRVDLRPVLLKWVLIIFHVYILEVLQFPGPPPVLSIYWHLSDRYIRNIRNTNIRPH